MDKLYNLLQDAKIRWGLYIGQPSIELLESFISGYSLCSHNIGNMDIEHCFNEFNDYICSKYKISLSLNKKYNWVDIIKLLSLSDYQAFYNFFEEFEEFLKSTPEERQKVIDEYNRVNLSKVFEKQSNNQEEH